MDMVDDCVFCRIIRESSAKEDTIYEDDKVLIILDIDWAVKGHTLVIWKEHHENASELKTTDFLHFAKIFHKTEKALLKTLTVERSLVLKSGALVSHFHFHIYPVRKETDWHTIKDIFDKKTRYDPRAGEKDSFVSILREALKG